MPAPTVTIKIAHAGARIWDVGSSSGTEDDVIKRSAAGHMWIVVDDGSGNKTSMGFGPETEGWPIDTGQTKGDDDERYIDSVEVGTTELTPQQYQDLLDFANDPANFGFDKDLYNALSNSCVDFSMKALEIIGLNPDAFEGNPFPTDNIAILRGMVHDAFPTWLW